jgi:hypothetical protein
MRWSFAFRAAGVVAVAALGSCSSASSGAFEDFSDPSILVRTESGCRLKIDVRVTAVAIWTDGAISPVELVAARRRRFVDRIGRGASSADARGATRLLRGLLARGAARRSDAQVEEPCGPIDVATCPPPSSRRQPRRPEGRAPGSSTWSTRNLTSRADDVLHALWLRRAAPG